MLGLTVRLPQTFDDIASILHSSTKLSDGCGHNDHDDLTYFQSFGYLQTIAFTIGYGHITPICQGGKVRIQSLDKSTLEQEYNFCFRSTHSFLHILPFPW